MYILNLRLLSGCLDLIIRPAIINVPEVSKLSYPTTSVVKESVGSNASAKPIKNM